MCYSWRVRSETVELVKLQTSHSVWLSFFCHHSITKHTQFLSELMYFQCAEHHHCLLTVHYRRKQERRHGLRYHSSLGLTLFSLPVSHQHFLFFSPLLLSCHTCTNVWHPDWYLSNWIVFQEVQILVLILVLKSDTLASAVCRSLPVYRTLFQRWSVWVLYL